MLSVVFECLKRPPICPFYLPPYPLLEIALFPLTYWPLVKWVWQVKYVQYPMDKND